MRVVRPSRLQNILQCETYYMLTTMAESEESDGNAYAQTGNMFHIGAAAYHKALLAKRNYNLAIQKALKISAPKYPLADVDQATKWLMLYIEKHQRDYKSNWTIQKIEETNHYIYKKEVNLQGTLDLLVKMPDKKTYVVDYKTGSPSAASMLQDHFYQLAAYMVLAKADGAYIARIRDLEQGGLFLYKLDLVHDEAQRIVNGVLNRVIELEKRLPTCNPNPSCRFCPLEFPGCATGRLTQKKQTTKKGLVSLL